MAPFSWDHVPQHYRQGHRRSLMLKSAVFKIHITPEIALELVQLVDEGVDLQIVGVLFNPQYHQLCNLFQNMRAPLSWNI